MMGRVRFGTIGLCLMALVAGESRAGEAPAPDAQTSDPTQVRPGAYALDPAHGRVTWSVSHLGFSTQYGHVVEVAARLDLDPKAPERSRLSATIGTAGIDGLDEALNRFLRGPDFLDSARFPTAVFQSTLVEPTGPTTARITGDLTVRDVTRPIAIDAVFNRAGAVEGTYTIGFDGRAVILRRDFGLGGLPPGIGEEITLRLQGEFKALP